MGCNLVVIQRHSLQTNFVNTTASLPLADIEGQGNEAVVLQGRENTRHSTHRAQDVRRPEACLERPVFMTAKFPENPE